MQTGAAEAPRRHGPVGVSAAVEQQSRHAGVVEPQRVRQRVADLPGGRFGGQQQAQALDVAPARRLPQRRPFVEGWPVGDVRAGGEQQPRQFGTANPSDARAQGRAIAAQRVRFAHAGVDVGAEFDQRLGEARPLPRRRRAAQARVQQTQQRRPAERRERLVHRCRREAAGAAGSGQQQTAEARARRQIRPAGDDGGGAAVVAGQGRGDQRAFGVLVAQRGHVNAAAQRGPARQPGFQGDDPSRLLRADAGRGRAGRVGQRAPHAQQGGGAAGGHGVIQRVGSRPQRVEAGRLGRGWRRLAHRLVGRLGAWLARHANHRGAGAERRLAGAPRCPPAGRMSASQWFW